MDYAELKIAAQEFQLRTPTGQSRLAGGSAIPFALGAPFWTGSATLAPAYHEDAGFAEVALMRLGRPGQTFLCFDARYNGPAGDRGGVILGASTPVVHSIESDRRSLRVSGLPGAYLLQVGDYIGITYGTAPERHWLGRVASDAVATGAGLTGVFEVEPRIPVGVSDGAPVALVRPVCRARVVSAAYGRGAPLITQGATFEWEQVIR